MTALLFVLFLYFQKTHEGFESKDGLKIGEHWMIKEVLPGQEEIKKAQKAGKDIDMDSIPKNLAIMFKSGPNWKQKFTLQSDGTMKGGKFESKK